MLHIPSFLFLEIRGSCGGHCVCLVYMVAIAFRNGVSQGGCVLCVKVVFYVSVFSLFFCIFFIFVAFLFLFSFPSDIHYSIPFMFLQKWLNEIVWFIHTFLNSLFLSYHTNSNWICSTAFLLVAFAPNYVPFCLIRFVIY